MKIYTTSEVRQNFAQVLDQAQLDGAVRIRRRNGQSFVLRPEPLTASPLAVTNGIPVPAFSTALAFFDQYRSAVLPANLLQAQRDYFGAHTYHRIDKPGHFHTDWAFVAAMAPVALGQIS